jgi:hypothetical protein
VLWGRLPAMVEAAIRYRAAEEALREPLER